MSAGVASLGLRVYLPNGVVVDLATEGDISRLEAVLQVVSRLF
ncbi:MAG: hypothetical protein ACREVK_04115 [Gammaproteobacteria bacterium]